MPYKSNADLPKQVRDALPDEAQSRFRTVVNSALERGLSDSKAFASGWTVVRNGWRKPKGDGKWERISKAAKQTLNASRPLENGQDLVNWAKAQGFKTTLQPDDMHATLIYSKEALQWPEASDDVVTVKSGDGRSVEKLGDQGAVVLRFPSLTLEGRHEALKKAGAKSDFPSFTPHVTISWKADDVDLTKVKPYTGPLVFGPERFKAIDPNWSPNNITEKRDPSHVIVVQAIDSNDNLDGLLHAIKDASDPGHSFSIVVDPGDENEKTFSFDGDGADRILSVNTRRVPMEKSGARHSASDRAAIQKMHDHAVELGAVCTGIEKDDRGEPMVAKFASSEVASVEIVKVDDGLGLVFGWAIISKIDGEEYFDVQGDHIPEESMLKATAEFMLSPRVAKEMHFGDEKGTIVFAFPVTEDIGKAMGLTSGKTGLMIAMKPHSEVLLNKFRKGPKGEPAEYTGFSIGGRRLVDEAA